MLPFDYVIMEIDQTRPGIFEGMPRGAYGYSSRPFHIHSPWPEAWDVEQTSILESVCKP